MEKKRNVTRYTISHTLVHVCIEFTFFFFVLLGEKNYVLFPLRTIVFMENSNENQNLNERKTNKHSQICFWFLFKIAHGLHNLCTKSHRYCLYWCLGSTHSVTQKLWNFFFFFFFLLFCCKTFTSSLSFSEIQIKSTKLQTIENKRRTF